MIDVIILTFCVRSSVVTIVASMFNQFIPILLKRMTYLRIFIKFNLNVSLVVRVPCFEGP